MWPRRSGHFLDFRSLETLSRAILKREAARRSERVREGNNFVSFLPIFAAAATEHTCGHGTTNTNYWLGTLQARSDGNNNKPVQSLRAVYQSASSDRPAGRPSPKHHAAKL